MSRVRKATYWNRFRRLALLLMGPVLIAQGLVALAGWPYPFTRTLKDIAAPADASWANGAFGMFSIALGLIALHVWRRPE